MISLDLTHWEATCVPGNEERLGGNGQGRKKEKDWNFCSGITAELQQVCLQLFCRTLG